MNQKIVVIPLRDIIIYILIGLFLVNQLFINRASSVLGLNQRNETIFKIGKISSNKVSSFSIVAPKVNPDGKTTTLIEWPTISEVARNPMSGNVLADAKMVMTAVGKPFYAPEEITFDDPIKAQEKWGIFEDSIKLTSNQEARYQKLIGSMMTCSYCCGSSDNITMNKNCGCAHARAVRGFYRYMIIKFGDQYSDEELVGESHRWYALWYPRGMIEDYLLYVGREDVLPHSPHGGSGSDGKHGLMG